MALLSTLKYFRSFAYTALLVVYTLFNSPFSFAFEVSVFDVGQGNAVTATYTPTKQAMVFDAGRTAYTKLAHHKEEKDEETARNEPYKIIEDSSQPFKWVLCSSIGFSPKSKAYKNAQQEAKKDEQKGFMPNFNSYIGNATLEAIFISHPDADHYNLIHKIDDTITPNVIVLGGKPSKYKNVDFKKYLAKNKFIQDDSYGTPGYLTRLTSSEKFKTHCKFDEDSVKVEVLSANANGKGDKNQDSLVIKVSHTHSMIIPGDAEKETWKDAEKSGDLSADVLLLSHHGSNTNGSTTLELLNKIKPHVCLISAGFQHGHPHYDILKLLKKYYKKEAYRVPYHFISYFKGSIKYEIITNAPVFSTLDNGVLKVDLTSDDLKITCSRDFQPTSRLLLTDSNNKYSYYYDYHKGEVLSNDEFEDECKKNSCIEEDENIYLLSNDTNSTGEGTYYYKYTDLIYLEVVRILEDEDGKRIYTGEASFSSEEEKKPKTPPKKVSSKKGSVKGTALKSSAKKTAKKTGTAKIFAPAPSKEASGK